MLIYTSTKILLYFILLAQYSFEMQYSNLIILLTQSTTSKDQVSRSRTRKLKKKLNALSVYIKPMQLTKTKTKMVDTQLTNEKRSRK